MVPVQGAGKVLEANIGSINLIHRTPFQRLPQTSEKMMYEVSLFEQRTGKRVPRNLEYGLDISLRTKVMNIEWSMEDREVDLVSFKRGDWEGELISYASTLAGGQLPLDKAP